MLTCEKVLQECETADNCYSHTNCCECTELYLKKQIADIHPETLLSHGVHIKLMYQEVKSAYERRNALMRYSEKSFNAFYKRIKCNCGENITASYILQAFIRLLQCDDERRRAVPLMPTSLHSVTVLHRAASKLSERESRVIHERLNVLPPLADVQN